MFTSKKVKYSSLCITLLITDNEPYSKTYTYSFGYLIHGYFILWCFTHEIEQNGIITTIITNYIQFYFSFNSFLQVCCNC